MASQKVAVEVAFALVGDGRQKIRVVKVQSLLTLRPSDVISCLAGGQTLRYQTPRLLDMWISI